MPEQIKFGVVLVLIIISGLGDSQGFLHAAGIWQDGKLIVGALLKSALGFGVGIVTYWLAIRYLGEMGVLAAEVQTIIWFGVTMIGVAVLSGRFQQWGLLDQVVAFAVLMGVGWLLLRTE